MMQRINFRALIFIDLLASALGGSIILMLILASKKPHSSLPAGKPRDFIFFKVIVPDESIRLKVFVNKQGAKGWHQSNFYDEENKHQAGIFSQLDAEEPNVKMWGPAYIRAGSDSVAYNVYITSPDSTSWVFSTLYFQNQEMEKASGQEKFDIMNKEISIVQHYRTKQKPDTAIIQKLTIGNVASPPVVVTIE
jgi:hypothetical protein